MSRQEFLSLETLATGPQLDGLVTLTKPATQLHRHADPTLWLSMGTPVNGWVVTDPCEYMTDTFGFVHLRGLVNGTSATSDVVFDSFPGNDTTLIPDTDHRWVCSGAAQPGHVVLTDTSLFWLPGLTASATPGQLSLEPVIYWAQVQG